MPVGVTPIAGEDVQRLLSLTSPLAIGADVRALQEAVKAGLEHYKVDWLPIKVDEELGRQTLHAATFYGWVLGTSSTAQGEMRRGSISESVQTILRDPAQRSAAYLERAAARKERLKEIRKAQKSGPKAAVSYAKSMIGVTENPAESNSGPNVTRKGKPGGVTFWESAFGLGSCFWCLCFACYCARNIGGAKVGGPLTNAAEIERMAKAHIEGWVTVSSDQARAGDIALFCFDGSGVPDHGELVVGPFKEGLSNDIGGNTSSDSAGSQSNGGGVFAKRRPLSQLTSVARPLYS